MTFGKHLSIRWILWILPLLVIGIFLGTQSRTKPPEENPSPSTKMTADAMSTHPVYPFDRVGLLSGLEQAKQAAKKLPPDTRGGIIPHHTLPSVFLAEFFLGLQSQPPATIVLIGPNHPNRGDAPVLSSDWDWETPFGTVATDREFLRRLESQIGYLGKDDDRLSEEHSVAGIMPYIKYFLPDTKVVPLIVKSTLSRDQLDQFSAAIAEQADARTVIVAPVDFSHYLTAKQAERNDRKTQEIMEHFDIDALLPLSNDFVDSPVSIGILLETMRRLGTTQTRLLDHGNSGFLAHDLNPPGGVTSYFVYAFSR